MLLFCLHVFRFFMFVFQHVSLQDFHRLNWAQSLYCFKTAIRHSEVLSQSLLFIYRSITSVSKQITEIICATLVCLLTRHIST